MFRKPKRKAKEALRQKETDYVEENDTSSLLSDARKKTKSTTITAVASSSEKPLLHSFDVEKNTEKRDLVTSTAEHHPIAPSEKPQDGIFRAPQNKFHAGPIKATQHVRVTARFDYQPDVCKDYKETGFCGFGDTCIYLHDRGDTKSGWQIEQEWQQEQEQKRKQQEEAMSKFMDGDVKQEDQIPEDGLPFACHLCRDYFKSPVVTNCGHYFCQKCILDHVRNTGVACPICEKDTNGVFNEPTKLITKKRKVLGAKRAKEEDSWKRFQQNISNKVG